MKAMPGICAGLLLLGLSLACRAEMGARYATQGGNLYAGGADLRIETPVSGDLIAGGGRVNLDSPVGQDTTLAGGSIDVRAPVQQDLRVAGGTVYIGADIGGELTGAAGTLTLGRNASVGGNVSLAGRNIEIEGRIAGDASIRAGTIVIAGTIDGDAHLKARQIRLLPGARIKGNLRYRSDDFEAAEGKAQIGGEVVREGVQERHASAVEWEDGGRRFLSWLQPLFILSMLMAGLLFRLLLPGTVQGARRTLGQHPGRSLLLGLALLFAIPPAAILLMVTVIGLPLGLAVLALYPVLLLLGYLCAAFFIGRWLADRMRQPESLRLGKEALFLVLGLIVLSLVGQIPFLGTALEFLALIGGIGALAVWLFQHRGSSGAAPDQLALPVD